MKIVYTNFYRNLTDILVEQAKESLAQGKRVFYIAPSSLSFEKERIILGKLSNGRDTASFNLMVTRFTQLSRYLLLDQVDDKKSISDTGYSMLMYKCLQKLSKDSLEVYNKLTTNSEFIAGLLELYRELQESNLSMVDIYQENPSPKNSDLLKIFLEFKAELDAGLYQEKSKIKQLTEALLTDKLTIDLQDVVIFIDGYTRFSAEEQELLEVLSSQVSDIIVGTYCSYKAYQSVYSYGSIYQASIDFMNKLKERFSVETIYVESTYLDSSFTRLTQNLERKYDFSSLDVSSQDTYDGIEIWNVVNQKEEIEHVAKKIRQLMFRNPELHYKDILVLLGERESYSLQLGQLFEKYAIPFTIGKSEKMQEHPLLSFLDSLLRIKRYNYQLEDVVNLLRTSLYNNVKREEVDQFEIYLKYADISGKHKFSKPFFLNHDEKYDLESLNQLRESLFGDHSPIQLLLNKRAQKSSSLLKHYFQFLQDCQLAVNFERLSSVANLEEQEQYQQVWNCFTDILTEFHLIFSDEKLSIDSFLELLRSAIFASDYRTVPANVDVVQVRPYDLIQPHSAKYVFAIGLSRDHFPKISKNTSLISDEERLQINHSFASSHLDYQLEITSEEISKQSFFTAISLYNSASIHLVLSAPDIYGESRSDQSEYLLELSDLGVPVYKKIAASDSESLEHIGSYEGLLSNFVRINQVEKTNPESEQSNFWRVLGNHLKRYLEKKLHFDLTAVDSKLYTSPLSQEVLDILYPENKDIKTSTSSIENYYSCQYKYFLSHQLKLQEVDSSKPDSRIHGMFLHRVFERVMNDSSNLSFDEKVEASLQKTRKEYKKDYESSQENQFLEQMLTDIVKESASVLKSPSSIQSLELEKYFSNRLPLENSSRFLKINGQIDRIDILDNKALGVVDYKSSSRKFNLYDFYHHQSLQLVTYLYALKQDEGLEFPKNFFGAMYLHLQNPQVQLSEGDPLVNLTNSLRYQGLVNEEVKSELGVAFNTSSSYSSEEIDTMISYVEKTYVDAAGKILSGAIAINPYAEKENTAKACQFCQFKSVCRFEANLHMGQANRVKKSRMTKEIKSQLLENMEAEIKK